MLLLFDVACIPGARCSGRHLWYTLHTVLHLLASPLLNIQKQADWLAGPAVWTSVAITATANRISSVRSIPLRFHARSVCALSATRLRNRPTAVSPIIKCCRRNDEVHKPNQCALKLCSIQFSFLILPY